MLRHGQREATLHVHHGKMTTRKGIFDGRGKHIVRPNFADGFDCCAKIGPVVAKYRRPSSNLG
jgi:hypothetical protein